MEPTSQPTNQTVPQPTTTSASTQATPAQLQVIVDYMPNVSVFGSKTVLLEWTADNRIRMYEMNFDTNQAVGIILDIALTDITKVTGSVNMLTFHVGDKAYRALFAAMRTSGAGAVGLGTALNELKMSGIKLWMNKLKQNGIQVKIFGWGKAWAIAIGIVAIAVIAVILKMVADGSL